MNGPSVGEPRQTYPFPVHGGQANVGILVLNPDLTLLHATREGWDIVRQLCGDHGRFLLPSVIVRMAEEVRQRLREAPNRGDAEPWVTRRLMEKEIPNLTLYGFAILDRTTTGPSHIVIVADRASARESIFSARKEQYQLSGREARIVRFIAQGLTNKEIGTQCAITEATVKVHVKHIMDKTGAATRTAILSRLYGL